MFDFTGKVTLVTGAASGIGRATASYFHGCGSKVVLADINEAAVKRVASEIDDAGLRTSAIRYDAADPASAEAAVTDALDRFGRLDYLVVAAGIYEQQPVRDMPDEDWRRLMGVNLDGVFYIARRAIAHMEWGGAIVTIASVAAHQGGTLGNTHYGAAKGGLLAFTRGLAREIAPDLRANTISPGWVETPMVQQSLARAGADITKAIPLQRVGRPSEIASIAAFLCSDAASFVTGEAIIAAGGAYMG